MQNRKISLKEIGKIINVKFIGEDLIINGLNYADNTSNYDSVLTYCLNSHYIRKALKKNNFRAIITSQKVFADLKPEEKQQASYFLVNDPISVFFSLHNYLYEKTDFYNDFNFTKKIENNCEIHPTAIIEDGVIIGNNVNIGANVCISKGTVIGNDVHIKALTVIGGNGFEVKKIFNMPKIIKHSGGVIIEDNVEIGSNACIDKSLFEGNSIIREGVKISNLVQIAHNVVINKNTLIAANACICGSVTIGKCSWIAPSVVVRDRTNIGENVKLGLGSVVTKNIPDNEIWFGNPAKSKEDYLKNKGRT